MLTRDYIREAKKLNFEIKELEAKLKAMKEQIIAEVEAGTDGKTWSDIGVTVSKCSREVLDSKAIKALFPKECAEHSHTTEYLQVRFK